MGGTMQTCIRALPAYEDLEPKFHAIPLQNVSAGNTETSPTAALLSRNRLGS